MNLEPQREEKEGKVRDGAVLSSIVFSHQKAGLKL